METRTAVSRLAALALLGAMLVGCQALPWGTRGLSTGGRSVPSGKITWTGFDCPEPNPRAQISSQQLDLYVWSEYIPAEFFECFELVYGIPVTYEEYDSVEEMYDLVAAQSAKFDLIQPTDFVIPRMVSEGLLRRLDHARLPSFANFNPHYLNLAFDPGNAYTMPYESGLDAIVVNTAAVLDVVDLIEDGFVGRVGDDRNVENNRCQHQDGEGEKFPISQGDKEASYLFHAVTVFYSKSCFNRDDP